MRHKIFDEILTSKFSDIIFQPTKNIIAPTNMYVINFVKEKRIYSLHISCFLRILLNNQIILTSTDECFDKNYKLITEYDKKYSLVHYNISNVKQFALGAVVSSIEISGCDDLVITLSNNMIIEIRPDCLMDSFEYYRLFEYTNPINQVIVSCNINNGNKIKK